MSARLPSFYSRQKERRENAEDRQRYCYNFREREKGGVEEMACATGKPAASGNVVGPVLIGNALGVMIDE